jgi:putative NADPH-quinone reductase
VLVVQAHPDPNSFSAAQLQVVERALEAAGHERRVLRLYDEGFRAAMTAEERRVYNTPSPILDPQVAEHAEHVGWAEVLVFVYPTWWSGHPAILKGWLERVLVQGVAFALDEETSKVRPLLGHIHHIVGISTYGAPRLYMRIVTDAGRRTLTRALRHSCGLRTRTTWLGLYGLDGSTARARAAFLDRIDRTIRDLPERGRRRTATSPLGPARGTGAS